MPLEAYFYVGAGDANYWVNIDSVMDLKLRAATAHVSQFDPLICKYRPDWDDKDLEKMKQGLRARATKKDGHVVEAYRISGGLNQP